MFLAGFKPLISYASGKIGKACKGPLRLSPASNTVSVKLVRHSMIGKELRKSGFWRDIQRQNGMAQSTIRSNMRTVKCTVGSFGRFK